jgi:hypothetical protein
MDDQELQRLLRTLHQELVETKRYTKVIASFATMTIWVLLAIVVLQVLGLVFMRM